MANMPPANKFEFNHSVDTFNELYSKLLLYLHYFIHGNGIVLYRRNPSSITNKKISFVPRVIYLVISRYTIRLFLFCIIYKTYIYCYNAVRVFIILLYLS